MCVCVYCTSVTIMLPLSLPYMLCSSDYNNNTHTHTYISTTMFNSKQKTILHIYAAALKRMSVD